MDHEHGDSKETKKDVFAKMPVAKAPFKDLSIKLKYLTISIFSVACALFCIR